MTAHPAATAVLVLLALVLGAAGGLTRCLPEPGASEPGASAEAGSETAAPIPTLAPPAAAPPTAAPAPTADPAPAEVGTARALLAEIAVKGRAAKTGYARTERFGTAWLDVDRNGCDTRNDILQRDLDEPVLAGRCKVLSGTLDDPYTGRRIEFVRGQDTSSLVQIDHVVALSDAWQKGAQALTQEERIALANDPVNLLAVDGTANARKGDGDAATWLPSRQAYRCEYVARQVSVKAAYGLWVTPAEHDAMDRVLAGCPGQVAYASELAAEFAGAHAGAGS